jgi:hypothetical protein
MDPKRRGEYQGVNDIFGALGSKWAPALYTFLALSWGAEGWLVIAGIIIVASIGMGPSVRMAQGFAQRNFPPEEETVPDAALTPDPA